MNEEEAERAFKTRCTHPDKFLHLVIVITIENPVLKCFKCRKIFNAKNQKSNLTN